MKTLRIPLQPDSRRRLAVASTSADVVRMQIIDMMVTARGERTFRPNYGAGVQEMLFNNVDPLVFTAKATEIREFLSGRVKGGQIHSVTLSEVEDRLGTLSVVVLFTLIPGGEVFTAEQTFTGLVTEESFSD